MPVPIDMLILAGATVGLVVLLVAMARGSRKVAATMREIGDDPAPGWHVQCLKCGRSRPLNEATGGGGIRKFANPGAVKLTLARCGGCRRLRVARVVHVSRMSDGVGQRA